jgi:hypothetical protein
MAACYSTSNSKETWLIDSGCTNHMTHNVGIFKELDKSFYSKVTIGNGEHVDVKGKGIVAVETLSGIKYISDVLFVPEINQSLLSVGQMMEKNYSLHFKDKKCTILDPTGSKLMTVEMRGKSFPIEWKQPTMPFVTQETTNSQQPTNKKINFSAAAAAMRGLGCIVGASQQVSVPTTIRASADLPHQENKNRKKEEQEKQQEQ